MDYSLASILIIEDDPHISDTLIDLLEMNGYNTAHANNGKDGLITALTNIPDLIICDINMPEMDGYSTITETRKHSKLQHIPFVFLSAYAEPQNIRQGMNLGADDFLTKPFHNEELLLTVNARLQRSQTAQANLLEEVKRVQADLEAQQQKIESYAHLNAHKVRGPLASMIGLIDLMLMNLLDPTEEAGQNTIRQLKQLCQQMDSVIHEVNTVLSR